MDEFEDEDPLNTPLTTSHTLEIPSANWTSAAPETSSSPLSPSALSPVLFAADAPQAVETLQPPAPPESSQAAESPDVPEYSTQKVFSMDTGLNADVVAWCPTSAVLVVGTYTLHESGVREGSITTVVPAAAGQFTVTGTLALPGTHLICSL